MSRTDRSSSTADNEHTGASSVRITQVAIPILSGNSWDGVDSPLTVQSAVNVSRVDATNSTTGDEEDERELDFESSGVGSWTLAPASTAWYEFSGLTPGIVNAPGSHIELDSDWRVMALTASGATITGGKTIETLDGSITISGGSVRGNVSGLCPLAATISVTGTSNSAGEIRQCNTHATGGPTAIGSGNSGLVNTSKHTDRCVWVLPEPVPPPAPILKIHLDVAPTPQPSPICAPGYALFPDMSYHQ